MVTKKSSASSRRWFAGLIAIALFAGACSESKGKGETDATNDTSASGEGDVDPDGVLRYAYDLETGITNLDPAISQNTCDKNIWTFVYDTLILDLGNGKLEPHVATAWEVTDAGKVVTLTLRDDVTYQDGTPLTAETVIDGLEYIQQNTNLTDIGHVVEFEAPDATTVVLTLDDSRGNSLVAALSGQDGMLVAPSAFGDAENHPVGAGPFTFKSFERGQSLVLERNADYWDADSWKLGGIEFRQAAFGPPSVQRYQADEVDVAKFLGDSYEVATKLPDSKVGTALAGQYAQLEFRQTSQQNGDTPFKDVKVRQAINHAINREEINEKVENGLGEITWQHFNSESPYHSDEFDARYPYDPDKARQLLAEAGYPDGFEFTMVIPGGVQNMENQGAIVQAQLAEVGITANIERSLPTNIAIEYYIQKKGAMFSAQELAVTFAPGMYSQWATGEFVAIHDGAEDAELTRLRDEAYAASTEEDLAAIMAEAEEYSIANALDVPIYHSPQYMVWNTERVGGTPVTPADSCTPIGLKGVYMIDQG